MINAFTLIGRLAHICDDYIVLNTVRTYKNSDGEYEADSFNVYISKNIAENVQSYCKKGDIIGVKGKLESLTYTKDGKEYRQLKLIGEKITFLSSSPNAPKEADSNEE